jgi:SsrA-binding protein
MAAAKKHPDDRDTLVAENRRARRDYTIDHTLECGIELQGAEVKSLRARAVSFADAYALVKGDELLLLGLKIDRWKNASTHVELAPDRTRRLLVKKDEIDKLKKQLQQRGLSIIPLKIYFKGPWAKVLLGIGKGKTHEDRREDIKRREANRDMERALRRR